jgi:prepilin-type processing-associated H-X9-DG protein
MHSQPSYFTRHTTARRPNAKSPGFTERFHSIQLVAKCGIDPKGIRTPVAAVKGRCPRPLDDGAGAVRLTVARGSADYSQGIQSVKYGRDLSLRYNRQNIEIPLMRDKPVLDYSSPPPSTRLGTILGLVSIGSLFAFIALAVFNGRGLSDTRLGLAILTIPLLMGVVTGILCVQKSKGAPIIISLFAWLSILTCSAFLLLGGLGIFGPDIGPGRSASARVRCASNLRQIGQGIALYANDNKGVFPTKLDDLPLATDLSFTCFVCPSSNDTAATGSTPALQLSDFQKPGHCSYVYLGNGMTINTPASLIVAYENPGNHEGGEVNFLFVDGHVEWFDKPLATHMLAELKAGHNPPRPSPP